MLKSLERVAIATALTLVASPVFAQTPPQAPATVTNPLGVYTATAQDLAVPQTRTRFQIPIWLGKERVTLDLLPNDIRSSDFRLLVSDASGVHQVATPPSVTWRGEVLGRAGSAVAATITDLGMTASIWLDHDGPVWSVQPARQLDPTRPEKEHVVYSSADIIPLNVSCGVQHETPVAVPPQGFGVDARKVAEVAIDCDRDYYVRFGSNVTQVQNQVTSVLNGVDTIYQRDVDIQYTVTTIVVRTTTTYTQTNMGNLLTQFANYWNSTQGGTQRDVAHLFTGKGSFSGVIGITWLGVVCNLGSAYGVDKAFSSNYASNVSLVSHELGHDWNAQHCDTLSSDCRIMCSGLGGCSGIITSFAPVSQSAMLAFKNTRNCLDDPFPPTITSLNPNQQSVFSATPITLTGTNLGGTSQVRFGTQNAAFAVVNSSTLAVTPPVPTALGATTVQAVTSVAASNSVPYTFLETSPPQFTAPAFGLSGYPIDFRMGGNPGDLWWILVTFNDPTTVPFLGYDVLLNHVILTSGALDAIGLGALSFPVPASANLAGVQVSTQLVLLSDTTLSLADISSVQPISFLL